MTAKKQDETDTAKDVVTSGAADTSPHGDHQAKDLLDSYSEAKDKPAAESVAQEQEPPANWPGTVRNAS